MSLFSKAKVTSEKNVNKKINKKIRIIKTYSLYNINETSPFLIRVLKKSFLAIHLKKVTYLESSCPPVASSYSREHLCFRKPPKISKLYAFEPTN